MAADVIIVMGSRSDLPALESSFKLLTGFGVSWAARVISAHRTPDVAADLARNAEADGTKIIICAAGMAAHLAGVIAAYTTLPVIGIPMAAAPFNGMDALLAMVQMPPGIPVATVTAGNAGGKNAALLAISILALQDSTLREKLKAFRKAQTEKVMDDDAKLQAELS